MDLQLKCGCGTINRIGFLVYFLICHVYLIVLCDGTTENKNPEELPFCTQQEFPEFST